LNIDDGDDDMGPVPRSLSLPSPAFTNAVPLGLTGASAEELMHVLGSESSLPSRSESERERNSNKRDADQREEWMLNPGEDRAIAG
jgi:hypothetical protein